MIYQFNITNIYTHISNSLVKLVVALVIFLFGFIIGKLAGRIVYKALKEIELNKFLKTSTGLRINADQFISNILSYVIYFLSLVAALDQIGVTNVILYLLSITVIVILLLSFFLAIRDLIPNLIAGIYLYSKLHLKEGSVIEVKDVKGKILQIDLFQVKISTKKGDIIYIPNSVVATSEIKIKS